MLTLSGCSADPKEASESASATKASTADSSALAKAKDDPKGYYLSQFRDWTDNRPSDKKLLDAAKKACQQIRKGTPARDVDVLAIKGEPKLSASMNPRVGFAAEIAFCLEKKPSE